MKRLSIALILLGACAPMQAAPLTDHQRVIVLEHKLATLSARTPKHTWPNLSASEKAALTAVLKTLPKGTRFDIVCNTASCDELAEDIDDCLEGAGFDSGLDHSAGPLGYGVGVQVNAADQPAAEAAIAALKRATGGRLDPPLMVAGPGQNPAGYVTILIGKYRAPKP